MKQGGHIYDTAVNAVIQQLERATKALPELKDLKTSSNAKWVLFAICDTEFVLCLVMVKIVLSNVNALCRYLQSSTMDVMSARKRQKERSRFFKVTETTKASTLFGR